MHAVPDIASRSYTCCSQTNGRRRRRSSSRCRNESSGIVSFASLFFLSFCFFFCSQPAYSLSQGHLLLQFSSSLRGSSVGDWPLPSWNSSDLTPCAWQGITCSADGNVTSVDLSDRGLSGPLQDEIFDLPHLVVLNLSLNFLHGPIAIAKPAAAASLRILSLSSNRLSGTIPPAISLLRSLQIIDFSVNNFSGSIPVAIASLPNLLSLSLFSNSINGTIPPEFGNTTSLRQLLLFSNSLTGPIPASLGNLTNLQRLRLGFNSLSGSIPAELGGCKNLQVLGLTQNNLQGEIPTALASISSLTSVALWKNSLTGEIPAEFGNLLNLSTLALYDNDLSGAIPWQLGRLQRLQYLYLYKNNLNGSIPWQLGNCSAMVELDLSMNDLSGEIPESVGNLQQMQLLHLFQNRLTGAIPPQLGNVQSLQILDLSINRLSQTIPVQLQTLASLSELVVAENQLTGEIPRELGFYSNLTVLDASSNRLSGSIPPYLCRNGKLYRLSLGYNSISGDIPAAVQNCTSLTIFDVHGNQISGQISARLGLLSRLTYLDLSDNRFVGAVPPELGNLQNLSYLLISGNRLTGAIPADLGKLSSLGLLSCDRNDLSGSIPVELANCKNLQKLNLSRNYFTGSIPTEISRLQKLAYLDLSDNKLAGTIPAEIGDLSKLIDLRLGSNGLSGEIPPELGKLTNLNIALSLRNNNLSGEIPPELGKLPLLNSLFLDQNQLTGEIPSTFDDSGSLLVFNVSFNRLTGPIPSIFNTMNPDNFLNNSGLCTSAATGSLLLQTLSPCSPASSSSSSASSLQDSSPRPRVRSLVAISVGAAVCAMAIAGTILSFFVFWRRRRTDYQEDHPRHRGGGDGDEESRLSCKGCQIGSVMTPELSFKEIIEATGNFSKSCEIGRGASGTVYRAELSSGKLIAVKRVPSQRDGSAIDNSFQAEIATLGRIRHSNIVKLYGFCYHQEANLLLYEYMPKGSVGEHLHRSPSPSNAQHVEEASHQDHSLRRSDHSSSLQASSSRRRRRSMDSWETRYQVAMGAAQGLAYLHHDCKPAIIHRDIKCNNILLDENMNAHVGDFGLAKILDVPYSMSMSAIAGSYGYIAPEYAYSMKITRKCDVYSFGVVLLELLTGRLPVQKVEQGGDLVTWVRCAIAEIRRKQKQAEGRNGGEEEEEDDDDDEAEAEEREMFRKEVFDVRLEEEMKKGEGVLQEMVMVLKIAMLCTAMVSAERPSMRDVVSMLAAVKSSSGKFTSSRRYALLFGRDVACPSATPPQHEGYKRLLFHSSSGKTSSSYRSSASSPFCQ